MKPIVICVLASLLAGCGTTANHSLGSLQFNQDVEPLREDYREVVLDAVRGRDTVSGSQILVSEPGIMSGETALSPQRWYVCVRGIRPVGSPPTATQLPLQEHVESWFGNNRRQGHYDVVVLLREGNLSPVVEGYDSRLCQDVSFSATL